MEDSSDKQSNGNTLNNNDNNKHHRANGNGNNHKNDISPKNYNLDEIDWFPINLRINQALIKI